MKLHPLVAAVGRRASKSVATVARFPRLLGLTVAAGALAVLPCAQAQTVVFNDTFNGSSTVNNATPTPANPSYNSTAYQQVAAKALNPAPPTIESGHLKFGIVSTSSGVNQLQALFTRYPVTLANDGDFIELTVLFTDQAGIFNAAANNAMMIGLYNGNQHQPYPGGQANSTAALSGGAEGWAGYVARVYVSGTGVTSQNANLLVYRAAQGSATSNQDLVFTSGFFTSAGTSSNPTFPAALTQGNQYTEVFRITKASSTTLTLAHSVYSGTDTSATPLFAQNTTTASIQTAVFDGLAVGYRGAGSVATTMDINSVKVVTTGAVLVVPQILTQPIGQTKTVGDAVTLAVVADGGAGTTLSYQWKKGDTDIQGATSSTYNIGAVTLGDAGDYSVVVTDSAGSTTSSTATLIVSAGAVAPEILTQPTGATLLVGAAKTFSFTASGTAPLTYRWQKSADGVAAYVDISGATDTSYAIASAVLADAGYYQAVVTNAQGSATTTPVQLIVNQAPVITTQPVGATLNVGAALNLSVVAMGTPAPTYQWKKNGVDISGATSASYSVGSVTGADTGTYSVIVTNSVSSITSSAVSVAVLSSSMAASAMTPANNATTILPDTPLTITFNTAPTLGTGGTLRIYDASNDGLVDSVDLAAATTLKTTLRTAAALSALDLPVANKTIGGAVNWNYYPFTISGSTVTIYPKNGALARGKSYYVQIDAGVFLDSTGLSFAGIADKTTWAFSTTSATPASATSLIVAADGSGDFYTVQAAVDYVPSANTTPTTIYIKNGTYFEMVYWTGKHNLTFVGQDVALTKIVYPTNNNFNGGGSSYHRGTFYGQSVHDIAIANLTIQNSTPQGGSQAEALILTGTSSSGVQTGRNLVTAVKLYSFQDTLQINGQCYVSDSYIEGDVDFLWGTGPVYLSNCDIRMKLRSGGGGYFTQIRNPATNHGYVFSACRITAEAGQTASWLGRIDPNSGQFPYSEVVLMNCVLGDAGNNTFLSTTVGASGSNFAAGWWLLNNVTTDVSATTAANTHNWDYNSLDYLGATPTFNTSGTRPAFSIMPTDSTTIAHYGDPVWVLNTTLSGTVNTTWTPALAPIITKQPVGASFKTGDAVTLGVSVAAVPAATYQWKKDNVAIPGATGASYLIAAAALADAGSYTVDVTNASGTVTSSAATLVASGPPTITTQPSAYQGIAAGRPVTFSIAATDSGAVTYQWKKDGNDISGATGATYSIAAPTAADAGDYTVVVTGTGGSVTSGVSHLAVAAAGGLSWQSYDQTGTRLSADAAVFDPETGTYALTIPANTAVTFVTKSFVPLVLSKPASGSNNLPVSFSMLASGGYGTNGSLQFHYTGFGLFNDAGTAPAAAGNFTDDKGLWIELYQSANAVSMKPQSVTSAVPNCPAGLMALNINSPYGMGTGTGGNVGTINDGMVVDMTVRPSALAAGTVQLGTSSSTNATAGGVLLDHATGGTLLQRRVYSSGSTGLSVASASITFNEFGYQFDNATDASVTLRLSNFSGLTIAPYFTTQPQAHGTFTVGDNVTLATAAVGAATYQWQISTDHGSTFSNLNTTANPTAATASLTLTGVQTSDTAIYQLVATNAAGSTTSVQTNLTVTASAFAPVIELQPMGATKLAGSAYTFAFTASASAPATYQWYKDGSAISGATSSTLAFASLTPSDAGSYHVTVTNGLGSVTSSDAVLVVQYVPVISSQPTGANVSPGAAVTLSVTADALPAATYQWKKNDVAISGATSSSYTIASATAADAGNYTVVVTNLAGSVTSATAPVNVLSSALTLSGSSVLQATGAGAYPETPITLNFSAAVSAGLNGSIKIYDAASPGTPVDTISFSSATARTATAALLALPTKTQTIGTLAGFNYYPVTISGSTATIYPTNGALTYGKSYYVTIDPGVFVDSTGLAFSGVSGTSTIAFTTKSAAPAAGTTVLTVAKDGSGDFCTLQAALDWVPAANTTPTRINLKDGTYYEIVYWTAKDQLTIVGQSRSGTIVGYANNNTLNPQGTNGRAAFEGRNSTGTVLANLTVKNFTRYGGTQAEAIYFNNADTAQTTITGVNLSSFQDTLNVNGPTYVSDSYIEGDTDFMWGNGPVFFNNCELKMLHSNSYYTQVRNPATNHGFVYSNCLFSADTGVTGSYLGRINQNAPAYTEVVLLNCREADTTLNPLAWDPNGLSDRSNTLCVEYNPTKQSDGSAVTVSGRVSWSFQWTSPANDAQIANYGNPSWVLNTQKDGSAKTTPTSWTPALAPILVAQPAAASVAVGQAASLSVGAVGVPSPTYQWKKNDVAIAGATAATYAIPSVAAGDAGGYTVVVTNSAGSVTSSAAALTIASSGSPAIDTPPTAKSATVGTDVTLTVVASGTAPLTYQWKKGGNNLTNAGRISGATTATLTLTGVQLVDAGDYTVVVTNGLGSATSAAATLTVTAPATPITPTITWSAPAAITYGTALGATQLNATASVDGTFAYTPAAGSKPGAGVQELSVTFTPTDTTSYTSATKKVNLTVNPARPTITWAAPAAIAPGTALSATQLNATANVAGTFVYDPAAGVVLSSGADQTLSVTFTPADQTNYEKATATTKITVTAAPPSITTQPHSVAVKVGASASLTVVATGGSQLTYQWFKDGTAVAGATSATLTFAATKVSDAGQYTVVVRSGDASVTSQAAALTVNFAGTYFGKFGSGGDWALEVRADNTGTLIAFLAQRQSALVLELVVNADGSFTVTGSEIRPLTAGTQSAASVRTASDDTNRQAQATGITLSGQITDGSVTGSIAGIGETFTGTIDPATGDAAALAGLYTASATGVSSGTTYVMIAANGDAVIVTTTPNFVGGGTGIVDSNRNLTVTAGDGSHFVITINAEQQSIAAAVTPAGSSTPISFAGVSDGVASVKRLVNASTRSFVGTGSHVLIVGFVIEGSSAKQVLLRAVGPGLTSAGVSGVLAHPRIQLHHGSAVVAENTGWSTAANQAEISSISTAAGAFALTAGSADSALLVTLDPGVYSAVVSGADGGTGVALVEIYEAPVASADPRRLVNLSGRGLIGTESNTFIAGFVISGNTPKQVLLRAVGPGIKSLGVDDAVTAVKLRLIRNSTVIASNDKWGSASSAPTITAAAAVVGAFPLVDGSADSALLITLEPGVYSAHATSPSGATGVALIEVYEVP